MDYIFSVFTGGDYEVATFLKLDDAIDFVEKFTGDEPIGTIDEVFLNKHGHEIETVVIKRRPVGTITRGVIVYVAQRVNLWNNEAITWVWMLDKSIVMASAKNIKREDDNGKKD